MKNGINNMRELKREKEKRKIMAEEGMKQIKHNFTMAKVESRNVLIKKVLIPVGIGILAGYGLKKLIKAWESDNDEYKPGSVRINHKDEPPIHHRSEIATKPEHSNVLFSNVDWTAMAIRILPFVLNVGKKMYDEGNLPFFHPPSESREGNDT